MTGTRRNLVANFAGTMWVAALALAFIPIYVRLLGVEAYGLVGFFTSMQAVFTLLDLGFGTTLNRELARLDPGSLHSTESRQLIQTLETIYWAAALAIAVLLCLSAPFIADRWIHRQTLSGETVRGALMLMAIAIGFAFPTSFYSGGLLGLQKHVRLNVALAGFGTLRWGGAAVLLTIRPALIPFFAWQASVSALQTLTLGTVFNHAAGIVPWRRYFAIRRLGRLKSFAMKLAAVTLLGALLTHADKLIVSRLAPLSVFGAYAIAATIAAGLVLIAMPFFTTVFPRLTQLSAAADESELRRVYHRVSQLLAAFLLPATVVAALFSREVLQAWTRQPEIALRAAPFLTVLAIGFGLHGLAHLPYALQLANGWVSLQMQLNIVAIVVLIPSSIVAVYRIGPIGAALAWVTLNLIYVVPGALIMHTRLLRGEQWTWYLVDLALPLCGALLIAVPARLLLASPGLPSLAAIAALTFACSILWTPAARSWMREYVLLLRRGAATHT
jgi:O-antigen/teichoic acid export membrane protein